MPTNNKVVLQPYLDNSIRHWPTPTLSARKLPSAARALVALVHTFNAEAMGKVMIRKAETLANNVQLSSMRGDLTDIGLRTKLQHTANSGAISWEIVAVHSARWLEGACGRESTATEHS